MQHKGTLELDTDRLALRKFRNNDAQTMFQNWASDPSVTRYLHWSAHKKIEETQQIIDMWCGCYSDKKFYQWAITLKDSDMLIGSISVVRIDEDVSECEIGYCIGKQWWSQGITTEACKKVVQFLFDQVGANRISAKHCVENIASGKVMQKCGMKYEGTLRQATITGAEEICDLAIYSVLRKDILSENTSI